MSQPDKKPPGSTGISDAAKASVYPIAFSLQRPSAGADAYLREPLIRKLVDFFEGKGLQVIKDEDRREQWYEDWLAYQATHQLYARLLSPRQYSGLESGFELLRYARFLEACAYFSPAHGYSLHVTSLGLWAILTGANPQLKREAVTTLESGGVLAFGVSERAHGSDLLGNEFTVARAGAGHFVANGEKYYIGNANAASIISILARRGERGEIDRRAPFVLFALRPGESKGLGGIGKIRTSGIRAAFVGEFEVKDHPLAEGDLIAEGRKAWNAVFGTVTLGKLFLGFGSIGICEHALEEAASHLRDRTLYGKPAIEMPHLRAKMTQAYARLLAMKLFAYRALDYVRAATEADRRFLLFAAVQMAKVSTEGVKVMALLSECIGARGFESETYFEMALRDVQLIPSLEGSTHINLGLIVQFARRYLGDPDPALAEPPSLIAGETASEENDYLMQARMGAISSVRFPGVLEAFRPLMSIANVRQFVEAAKAFQLLVRGRDLGRTSRADTPATLALGQCVATIAYAQLIAENAVRLRVPAPIVAATFQALVDDFSIAALTLASSEVHAPHLFRRLVSTASLADRDADVVWNHIRQG